MDPNIHNTQGNGQATREDADQGAQDGEEDPQVLGKVVGDRVGRLRTQRNMSQRRLQLEAGLGHGYLSNLEAGRVPNPGIQQLYKVATALGVPLSLLVTEDHSSVSASIEQQGHVSSPNVEESAHSRMAPELEELQRRVEELWSLDKERFAALRLVVSDMQQKAADTARPTRERKK